MRLARLQTPLAVKDGTGRYSAPKQAQGSRKSELRKETPAAEALFCAIQGPKWRQIACPPLTPNQFHCATVPDGPDGKWKGGEFERIEAKNRAALRAHFAKQAKDCLIQPHHPPVNILGGYKFPDVPVIDLTAIEPTQIDGMPASWQPCLPSDHATLPDLSILAFLRR